MERNKWKINVLLIIIMVLVVLGCILGFFYFTKDKTQNKVKKAKIKKDKNGKNFSHSLVDNAVFGYRA